MNKYGMITSEEALVLSNKFCELLRQIFEDRPDDEEEERTCKNCKFIERDRIDDPIYICANDKLNEFCSDSFYPNKDFGCNQWKKKE